MQKGDVVNRNRFGSDPQHNSVTVAEPGVAGQVAFRLVHGNFTYSANIGKLLQRLGVNQVFQKEFSSLIDVRIDFMRGDCLAGKPYPYIPAYLTEKYRNSVEFCRGHPQA